MSVEPDPPRDERAASSRVAPDGVDLARIRWMLSLTPEERLRDLQARHDAMDAVHGPLERWTPPRN